MRSPRTLHRFIYCNVGGEVAIHEVRDVSKSNDHLQGECLVCSRFQTFRKDRILEDIPDGLLTEDIERRLEHFIALVAANPPAWVKEPIESSRPPRNALDVCFTGFKKSDKERLTSLAKDNDLVVRANVTDYLTFLCYGYNAGPKKMEKARHQGVVILSERQFLHMLESGEIPEDPE